MASPPDYIARYPADWDLRAYFVTKVRARCVCECCGARENWYHPKTGAITILQCAHLHNQDPEDASLLNLAALCQLCHNLLDQHARICRRKDRRELVEPQLSLDFLQGVHRVPYIPTIAALKARVSRRPDWLSVLPRGLQVQSRIVTLTHHD